MKTDHDFKRQFGQNFITDVNIVIDTVDLLELDGSDHVLEVGPGDGRFTDLIANNVKSLELVEIDEDLTTYLREAFAETECDLRVTKKDILEFDLSEYKDKKYKVFGALPYNISKPIISKFLQAENKPELMVFIIQFEVAEDYAAQVPKSKFLANYAQIYGDVTFEGKISKEKFTPMPKVHGGIIKIRPTSLKSENPKEFAKFMKNGFRTPRKKLLNTLNGIYNEVNWEEVFKKINLPTNTRAAEVRFEDWKSLFEEI